MVLVAALSGANAALYAATRQLHSLGSERMAPRVFARTNGRGVPAQALALSTLGAIVAVVMAISGVGGIFTYMMALVTVCVLVVWAMILISYLKFKKVEGNKSPFTVWGGAATATVGLIGVIATFVAMFFIGDMLASVAVGLGFFLLITVIYFAGVNKQIATNDDAFAEAKTMTAQIPTVQKK